LKFHSPDKPPHITIEAQNINSKAQGNDRQAAMCQLVIRDNGIGFDEKYTERIFQPFQRLHSREEYPGTGMGLAICRKIVERHQGSITAHSVPGNGATFIVELPLDQSNGGTL